MRPVAIAALAGFAMSLSACSGGDAAEAAPDPGPHETRNFAGEGFTAVTATGPDQVIIRQGDSFAVVASGPRAVLDRLDIAVDGSALRISREPGINYGRLGTAVITVILPRLSAISATGSGNVGADRLDGERAELNLTGSGNVTVRDGVVGSVAINLTGSGDMTLTGRAQSADVDVLGSGNISAITFGADNADVSVTGSGSVNMNVDETARISILGSGDVNLTGGANCTINRRGSGSANCS
jgi:hypothetical protein